MENTAGVEIHRLMRMVKTEMIPALRDILQFLEEEVILTDVENFNRKVQAIEDIRKKYPWLKQPISYKKNNNSLNSEKYQ